MTHALICSFWISARQGNFAIAQKEFDLSTYITNITYVEYLYSKWRQQIEKGDLKKIFDHLKKPTAHWVR